MKPSCKNGSSIFDAAESALVTRLAVSCHEDGHGRLTSIDFNALPFPPVRAFTICNVPTGTVRGGHAHRTAHQILICTNGRVRVELRRDGEFEAIDCVPSGPVLLVSPRVWSRQAYLEPATSLLVLCSEPYDPDSYLDEHGQPLR